MPSVSQVDERSKEALAYPPRLLVFQFNPRQLATASANGRAAEADRALATAALAAAQAAAHALHDFQATQVLAAAAKANAIYEHLARAFAAVKAALAAAHVFARTAHTADAAIQLAAELLKLRARGFVVRRAENLATLRTFLHANFAAERVGLSRARLLLGLRVRTTRVLR
jgi:hypothetical protein